ncbi:MAG: methionine biosynthesis protein MetW [bacterium]|nr:methionine biosynthesis protein MetW [bacterium]
MSVHRGLGYDLIIPLVPENSRVLDLGCGDGYLLEKLQTIKQVRGFGVEISESGVSQCVEKGLYCYQGDIDEGLSDYRANSFDFVILNQTIQSTKRPEYVLHEIMRISKKTIISFPNFGYSMIRLALLLKGTMPKGDSIPYEWYESPNIHLLSIRDFQRFCKKNKYPIEMEYHFSVSKPGKSRVISVKPNILAQYGFFLLNGENFLSAP